MVKGKSGKQDKKKKLLANKMVREFLLQVAGEHALKIVKAVSRPVSDEKLAESCKIKVSEVRAVLNKLHLHGIATYERKKDNETGWYSYVWNVELGKANDVVSSQIARKKTAMEKLSYETAENFYKCDSCVDFKLHFNDAMDNNFKCPQCGSKLAYFDATRFATPKKH